MRMGRLPSERWCLPQNWPEWLWWGRGGGVEDIGGAHLQWLSWQPDLAPKRMASPPKPYEAWNTRAASLSLSLNDS